MFYSSETNKQRTEKSNMNQTINWIQRFCVKCNGIRIVNGKREPLFMALILIINQSS